MDVMALQLTEGGASHVPLLRRLLDTHDLIDTRDYLTGNTLLHAAVLAANAEAVALLVQRYPSLCTAQNFAGQTPHELASEDFYRSALTNGSKGPSSAGATISRALATVATFANIRDLLNGACDATTPPLPAPSLSRAEKAEPEAEGEGGTRIFLWALPDELLEVILQHLGGADDLPRLRMCSSRLREISDADAIWERLCWNTYKIQRTNHYQPWREVFIEHHVLQSMAKGPQRDRDREARDRDRREAAGLTS